MIQEAFQYVCQNPCSPEAHERLADEYFKNCRMMPSIAEYRSSIALGSASIQAYLNLAIAYLRIGRTNYSISACQAALSRWNDVVTQNIFNNMISNSTGLSTYNNEVYDHNLYYRLKTISQHLLSLFGHEGFSLLDIGGGEGDLSLFLPNSRYVLAEPVVNGISGLNLTFEDKYFDCVVACHVFEHIPPSLRESFLDQLCRKAKNYVILLSPFCTKHGNDIEQLIYELSQAAWAKEHLECTLPRVEDIVSYAATRNISYRIIPNGSQFVTAAVVFMDYFAEISGRRNEWNKVTQLLNKFDSSDLENFNSPNAYLIELKT